LLKVHQEGDHARSSYCNIHHIQGDRVSRFLSYLL